MITNKLITPESYQTEAITRVRNHLLTYLEVNNEDKLDEVLLQSSVASGKTVMGGLIMESLLDHLERDKEKYHNSEVSFVWISTADGGLANQSKDSVDSFTGKSLNVMDLQTVMNKRKLQHGDALFLSWESVQSDNNIVRRNNEIGNIDEILEETDSKIIMIIDESHRDRGGGQNAKVINELIKPFAILNLTATPTSENREGDIVSVDPQRVIDAGRIRKQVKINDNILDCEDGVSYKSKVLSAALSKQQEIIDFAIENNISDYISQNPLILIQIANDRASVKDESKQLDEVMQLLFDNGVKDDEIAINLSNKKKLFDDIDNNNAKVLIMKQAISTGWDCPRAQILVQFREVKSVTFHLQTLGRIMRTLKGRHYGYELLDNSYLYTDANDDQYHFDGSIDDDMINATGLTRESAKLRQRFIDDIGIFTIPMEKVIFERLGEIDSEFLWNGFREGIEYDRLDGTNLDSLVERKSGGYNIESGAVLQGEDLDLTFDSHYEHTLTDEELESEFSRSVDGRLSNYNIGTMLMYLLSDHPESVNYEDRDSFVHRLFYKNKVEMNRVISNVIRDFKNMQANRQMEETPFTIQEEVFRAGLKDSAVLNYAYDREDTPDSKSASEKPFVGFLKNRDEVQYWFINQVSDDDFSIVYFDTDNKPRQYHPDFFIIDEHNRLFIVDIKSKHGDGNYEYTKEKYEAGKQFENVLNNSEHPFEDIIFSMVRLDEYENPTILTGNIYREDYTKDWVDFIDVLKQDEVAR